jgi:hypothetical protein
MKRFLATVCATLWVLPSALYAQGLGASQLILTNSSGGGVILQPDPMAPPPLQPLLITPPPAAGHQLVYTPAGWTLNRLVKWTDAAAPVLGNSLISDDGTTVEIGNGNLSITNTDGTARELRLYEPSGSGSNYTAFRAQAQASDITYTLPADLSAGTLVSGGRILQSDGSGTLSWLDPTALAAATAWALTGNSITGTEFLGTTNAQPLVIRTDNTERMRITATGDVVVQNQAPGTPTTVLQVLGGNGGTGATQVVLQAGAGQSGVNLLEWRDNLGNILGVIDADGLVGIGTATPVQKLHVKGNGSVSAVFVEGGVGVGTDNPLATLHVYDAGTLTLGATRVIIQAGANQSGVNLLEWQDNSGNILGVIDADGLVGIGTATPVQKLHVEGNGSVSAVFVEGGVGVGTVNPLATLHVYDAGTLTLGATRVIIQAGANQSGVNLLEWQDNSGNILGVIDADGLVGIGTATPAADAGCEWQDNSAPSPSRQRQRCPILEAT